MSKKTTEILIDTSYLYAIYDGSDKHHDEALAFADWASNIPLLLTDVVLTETSFMLRKRVGFHVAAQFLGDMVASGLPVLCIDKSDLSRAYEVMSAYPDSKLDFTDCCLVALGERLHVTRVCTFDRRDFGIIRPKHISYFDIFPKAE